MDILLTNPQGLSFLYSAVKRGVDAVVHFFGPGHGYTLLARRAFPRI